MSISIFDLFSIGIGPSSSHTVGPMRAAKSFVDSLENLAQISKIKVTVYGSLAWTGYGHGTDFAILMGLQGETPEKINPGTINKKVAKIKQKRQLEIAKYKINFNVVEDLVFDKINLKPYHSNAMLFQALNGDNIISSQIYYSVGGGFIVDDAILVNQELSTHKQHVKYPFSNFATLKYYCERQKLTIAQVVHANETCFNSKVVIRKKILKIWEVMQRCIISGCNNTGELPGGLSVNRRANNIYNKLIQRDTNDSLPNSSGMDWASCYAIAVNEENAAGGRVVTAPTNGAAGVIPAVLNYYMCFHKQANANKVLEFILTAGAIAILYKEGASISAAEVGCQGEVGVACSMAAAALTAVLGGNLKQIENAAEIAMEHHLGLTCDPIGGLVQIPCIERNAMAAVKAINTARLCMLEEGTHSKVPLDKVIATMRSTGMDMMSKYKETSTGGLALNLPEC